MWAALTEHEIVPPLSLCGPTLNVRKFSAIPLRPASIVANGTISPPRLAFLAACVGRRANVIVSGGTSSGKTTLLGVLSLFVPDGERIITIETRSRAPAREAARAREELAEFVVAVGTGSGSPRVGISRQALAYRLRRYGGWG